jgi:hypothetical protein
MTLKSPGEAYTEKRIVLKSEVGGVVKNLYAAEGRHVREGDLLVEPRTANTAWRSSGTRPTGFVTSRSSSLNGSSR